MKSPFPGMDPYLQQYWGDVHSSLVIYARDQLYANLPTGLIARAQERVYVEREDEPDRSLYPDVHVVERPQAKITSEAVAGGVALAEPLIVHFRNEPVTERFIEILDAKSGLRVITIIEVISPTNKVPGRGYKLFRQKQKEAKRAGVSLVEIDLILRGKRVLSVPLSRIKYQYRTRYQAIVRRGCKWDEAEVYPIHLRERLPTIGIPLRESEPDVPLNLQDILERAYQIGHYEDIDYQEDADPPLEGHDAEWADALLRAAGKRK
jgi:Protein of unknown function (DUF4058)